MILSYFLKNLIVIDLTKKGVKKLTAEQINIIKMKKNLT